MILRRLYFNNTAEGAKLFRNYGTILIGAFISPVREIQRMTGKIIEDNDFPEIFVDTPLEICEQRDTKGLYKKARKGIIKNFTGISSPFETPENPFTVVENTSPDVNETVRKLLIKIIPEIKFDPSVNL